MIRSFKDRKTEDFFSGKVFGIVWRNCDRTGKVSIVFVLMTSGVFVLFGEKMARTR